MSLQITVSWDDAKNASNYSRPVILITVSGDRIKFENVASLFGLFQVVNGFTASNRLITAAPTPVNNAANSQSF